MPRASLRSVLLICAFSAALMCRVSTPSFESLALTMELRSTIGVESSIWPKNCDASNFAISPWRTDLELEGAWRVEYLDSDGAGYIAIFAGQSAEVRARDYYDAIERGALKTRIADAQVVTTKSRLVPTEKMAASSLRRRRFQFGQGSLHSVQDNGTGRIEVAEHRCR